MSLIWIILTPVSLLVGFGLGWLLRQSFGQKRLAKATDLAEAVVSDARSEAESLKREKLLELKEEKFQMKKMSLGKEKKELKEKFKLKQG